MFGFRFLPGYFINFVARVRKVLWLQGKRRIGCGAYWLYVSNPNCRLTRQTQCFSHSEQRLMKYPG